MDDDLRAEGLLLGVARAEPYAETERHIAERRARGLFGDLRFTLTNAGRSCHPEGLVRGARSVIAAALPLWRPAAERPPGLAGRMPRYAWRDPYAPLRERLRGVADQLRARGARAAVFVDSNHHVDREAAVRAGLAFYGKNTMAIVPREGSFVALGAIVTDAELEPAAELVPPGCGSCTLCIDACPTNALDEPGVLDATRCLSTVTQAREPVAEPYATALEDRVYGCDICQDVCPWNAGPARRGADLPPEDGAWVSLADWLELPGEELLARHAHLYVPERDPRYLQRNALVALGNSGDPDGRRARAALRRGRRSAARRRCAPRARAARLERHERAGVLRLGRAQHAVGEEHVVGADAQVRDDHAARGPWRRVVGQPASDRPVGHAPACEMALPGVGLLLLDVVRGQELGVRHDVRADRGRVVDRQHERVLADRGDRDAAALGADRDAGHDHRRPVGRLGGAGRIAHGDGRHVLGGPGAQPLEVGRAGDPRPRPRARPSASATRRCERASTPAPVIAMWPGAAGERRSMQAPLAAAVRAAVRPEAATSPRACPVAASHSSTTAAIAAMPSSRLPG